MINTLLILALAACGGGCRDRHDDDSKVPAPHDTDTSSDTGVGIV